MLDRIPAVVIVCAVAVVCVLVSGKMSPSRPDVSLVQGELPLPTLESPSSPPASHPMLNLAEDRVEHRAVSPDAARYAASQPAQAVSSSHSAPSALTPTTRPASRIGASLPVRDRTGRRVAANPI
jgi:hypothetical protein